MAEPKSLTYDEQKAAEAAFTGNPPNPDWTEAAQRLYARLSAAMHARVHGTTAHALASDLEHPVGSRQ